METVTIEAYSFEELDEEIQRKVIDRNRQINTYHGWWDYILRDFVREAKELGFDISLDDITFSLYRDSHFGVLRKNIETNNNLLGDGYSVYIYWEEEPEKIGYRCGRAYTRRGFYEKRETGIIGIEELWKNGTLIEKDEEETLEGVFMRKIFEECEEKVWEKLEKLVELCEKYYKVLSKEWVYLESDEAVKETIKANDFRFKKNGERI